MEKNHSPEPATKEKESDEIHFYGVEIPPPTEETARAFGSEDELVPLEGGQKTTYRSGEIILKPSEGTSSSIWMAETFDSLAENPLVRFAKPINTVDGEWIEDEYVAWSYLQGEHVKGQYDKKLASSRAFHELLTNIPKPDFVGLAKSSWSTADLVAWQKLEFQYDQEFMGLYDQIEPKLNSLDLPEQLIHGDLSGNFLLDEELPPAVIDFSPAWAPSGFAEGIMFVDALVWENADPKELEAFLKIPEFDQFAWRGVLRRITEQAEHIKWFDKSKKQAVKEASNFQKAIDYLKKKF